MNEQFEKDMKVITDEITGDKTLAKDDLIRLVTVVARYFHKTGQEHILNLPKTHPK
jgi:hypothetical protein